MQRRFHATRVADSATAAPVADLSEASCVVALQWRYYGVVVAVTILMRGSRVTVALP